MTPTPTNPATVAADSERLAALLDELIDARRTGREAVDAELLAAHPELAEALAALDQLGAFPSTLTDPAPPPSAPPQFEVIGPYRVEGVLGSGGFGAVYLAFDPDLKRRVALKVLHTGRVDQPGILERFQREACATARLRHPGIVQLYDYSRQGPPYYLVTEYVEGLDLRAWARRQPLTPVECAHLVARVAEVIDYAHSEGVYHRDLKPGNILIDARGEPHVLDFGLARLYRQFEESDSAPTSDGRILGTLAYMAPEQAAGRSHHADARSDVYSLGVILYELLTGRPPFEGPAHALPAQVVEANPQPPRSLRPDLPRALEAICLKALAKRPEDRYRSAAAFARDLRAFLRGEPVEAHPLTWVTRMHKELNRRHQVVAQHDWGRLLFLQAVTVLAGCTLLNVWQLWDATRSVWWPILVTKVVQVFIMVYLVLRFRPLHAHEWTLGERQIWAMVPAYYLAFLTAWGVSILTDTRGQLPALLCVMSGMGLVTLGATIWGWLYFLGASFFGLALYLAYSHSPYGMFLLGLAWFLCMSLSALQLRNRR